MKYQIKTLTPVHIGTGTVKEPFEYVISNDELIVLNPDTCFQLLYEDDPANVDRFYEWFNQIKDEIDRLNGERRRRRRGFTQEQNKQLSQLQRNFQIYYFTEKEIRKPALARKMVSDSQYYLYKGYCPAPPRGKRQLREQIKIGAEPYIPGSSIKGLFRTALLFSLIKNLSPEEAKEFVQFQYRYKHPNSIRTFLDEIKRKRQNAIRKVESGNSNDIQQAIKIYKKELTHAEKEIGNAVDGYFLFCKNPDGEYRDPLYDLFKFVEISDAHLLTGDLAMYELATFTRDRRNQSFKYQPLNITEFIDEESILEFDIHIKSYEIYQLIHGDHSRWVDLEDKLSLVLSVEKQALRDMKPEDIERQWIERLFSSLEEYGKSNRLRDIQWFRQFHDQGMNSFIKQLESMPEHSAKIGFGSGWHAMTVGLAMSENPTLKEIAGEVVYSFHLHLIQKQKNILFPKGNNLHRDKIENWLSIVNRKPDMNSFPSSRRLTILNRQPSQLVGWVQIGENLYKEHSHPKDVETANTVDQDDPENMEEMLKKLKEKFSS